MILFSHPTGNANVRQAALGLRRAGLLGEFWTCIDYKDSFWTRRFLPGSLADQLRRRSNPAELAGHIHASPFREVARLLASRAGLRSLTRHEEGLLSVDAVYGALDRRVAARIARGDFEAVYAYEDGAAESFRAAAKRGLLRFYDLPIGYWRSARTLLQEEAVREPEWAATLTGNLDSPVKTDRKDAELRQADLVLVASNFTRRTLEDAPDFKGSVAVIPYGAPLPSEPAPEERAPPASGGPLRVLFVGGLSQRKGLSYLFQACRQLRGGVSLTVIGAAATVDCAALDRELKAIRWIPTCTHGQVLAEMAAHDVFVFPSLFEGFGLVLLEAMSRGLPIIATPNTAGPDLITDGVEGFIVPIRSAEALVDKLDLLRSDPARRTEMAGAARLRARAFRWESYGDSLAACVGAALRRH